MKQVFLTSLALLILAPVVVVLFAWSGVYSIAADRGHYGLVRWLLEFGMRNSVERHASAITAPPLNDPALLERGAGHFHTGCAPCHGAPGLPPSPIPQQMLPAPPDLSKLVPTWSAEQLFWIVKHGLKYTGMPGWPAAVREDEVWAVVALLVRLPAIDTETYRRFAFAGTWSRGSGWPLASERVADPIACARCHGSRGEGSEGGGIPRLAGQKPEYLMMTLQDYRHGARPSGIMQSIATYLSDDDVRQLALHYASIETSQNPAVTADAGNQPTPDTSLLQLGGAIAAVGIPSRGVPPCSSCHGERGRAEQTNPKYPALAGQHPDYLVYQLKLWRADVRGGTFDQLMSTAARNLTDHDILAVAVYYSRLDPR
jgi:cytochrome c553